MAFSWYKNVYINIFVFFQNRIVESKSKLIFLETYIEKFHKYFWFFHWNPYLKTDSTNFHILFSVNDFNKKICGNFYVIFIYNVSGNNICIALGKTQNVKEIKNQNIATEK